MRMKRISFDNPEAFAELLKNPQGEKSDDRLHSVAVRALREIVKEELSERQKQFIVLYYYENKKMTDIADICGVNVSTVSRTLRRARKNITDHMKYYYLK